MKNQLLSFAAILAFAFGVASAAYPANGSGYVLVVNPGNPASGLTKTEVARLFLKKVTTWPDGKPVAAVDQPRTAAVRKEFSLDVHQKDADAVSAYWQVLVFSGRDVPPRIVRSDDEVLAFVRLNVGAIGYVSAGASLEGVKKVAVR
jgi:ABC-type phosphate transport system substrate-binding protein